MAHELYKIEQKQTNAFPFLAIQASSINHPFSLPSAQARLEQARTAALDSLHLGVAVDRPSEPLRQLVAVPEFALLRVHASHLASRTAAHEAVGLRRGAAAGAAAAAAHHRTMLAGFLAVLGEGLGEGFGGGGGVDLGSVVDFCGWKVRSGCDLRISRGSLTLGD